MSDRESFEEYAKDNPQVEWSGRSNAVSDFKVGDKVMAFGIEGEVVEILNRDYYPVKAWLYDTCTYFFTSDGKAADWHKTPSLKLIERPKKNKVFKEWICKEGLISDRLLGDNFKDPFGVSWENEFLMWTGREFELEVEG